MFRLQLYKIYINNGVARLDVKGADDARQLDAALGRLSGRFLDEETIARAQVPVPELSAAPAV